MSAESANERIRWLHSRIKDGYYPNAMRLSERFGISHRQAQRDVVYLTREIGAPAVFVPARHGYAYTEDFSLPEAIRNDEGDCVELLSSVTSSRDGEITAAREATQMRIPYTAVLEIPDKLTALELHKLILGKAEGNGRYRCEFDNVGLFLGILLAADTGIRVVEPEWLREKLMSAAWKLIKSNS